MVIILRSGNSVGPRRGSVLGRFNPLCSLCGFFFSVGFVDAPKAWNRARARVTREVFYPLGRFRLMRDPVWSWDLGLWRELVDPQRLKSVFSVY